MYEKQLKNNSKVLKNNKSTRKCPRQSSMSRLEFFGRIDLFCEITRAAREYKHNTGGGGGGEEKKSFNLKF